MPPHRAAFLFLLAFLGALALLIGDAAAGLASGLAGSLALAATAVLSAVAKITGLDSLDMLHNSNLRWFRYNRYLIITPFTQKVNTKQKNHRKFCW